jgi:hypothetical protein
MSKWVTSRKWPLLQTFISEGVSSIKGTTTLWRLKLHTFLTFTTYENKGQASDAGQLALGEMDPSTCWSESLVELMWPDM